MANNRDNELYNCGEIHEEDYVVGLYDRIDREDVRKLLIEACNDKRIYRSTHEKVYKLIKKVLGLDIPIEQ